MLAAPAFATRASALAPRTSVLASCACLLTICACLLATSPANAASAAALHASFAPDRPGASTSLTLALRFSGGSEGVPAPLRSVVLRLPAGLGIDLRGVSTCAPARLRRGGAAGCPQRALLGRGHARMEVHAGSQTIPEQATLWAFLGPHSGTSRGSVEILGAGSTPLDERTLSTGALHSDSAPFGEKLTIAVPPIPTVMLEPDASFDSLSLTVGALRTAGGQTYGARILVPRRCPSGGYPFAATIRFADGSTADASSTVRCP